MSPKMSPKISLRLCGSALVAGSVIAALAVSLGAGGAAAASRNRHAAAHRVHHTSFMRERGYGGLYDYDPGLFIPGVDLVGRACDLPTSRCPNDYRISD